MPENRQKNGGKKMENLRVGKRTPIPIFLPPFFCLISESAFRFAICHLPFAISGRSLLCALCLSAVFFSSCCSPTPPPPPKPPGPPSPAPPAPGATGGGWAAP